VGEAQYNLANALAGEGELAEAIQHLQQAMNLATVRNQISIDLDRSLSQATVADYQSDTRRRL